MIKNVLLDLDGSLNCFASAALKKLNTAYPEKAMTLEEYRKVPTFDMADRFQISQGDFWKAIDNNNFWDEIEPFPWAEKLYRRLGYIAPVTISTSPSLNPDCIPQKLKWLERILGVKSDKVMFGGRKYLMARPDNLLIDDYPRNTEKFIAAGGRAVLIPSSWNTEGLCYEMVDNAIQMEELLHTVNE